MKLSYLASLYVCFLACVLDDREKILAHEKNSKTFSLKNRMLHYFFLEFLFLTVEHYNEFWYKKLQQENIWSELSSNLPRC